MGAAPSERRAVDKAGGSVRERKAQPPSPHLTPALQGLRRGRQPPSLLQDTINAHVVPVDAQAPSTRGYWGFPLAGHVASLNQVRTLIYQLG